MNSGNTPVHNLDHVPQEMNQHSSSLPLAERTAQGGCNGGNGNACPPCPTADCRETVRVVGTSAATAANNGGIPQPNKLRSATKQIRLVLPGWLVNEMEKLAPTRMGEMINLALMSRIKNPAGLPQLVESVEQVRRLGVLLAQTLSYGAKASKDSDLAELVSEIENLVFDIKRLSIPRSKAHQVKSAPSKAASPDNGRSQRRHRWDGAAFSVRLRLPVELADDLLSMPPDVRSRGLWLILSPEPSQLFDLVKMSCHKNGFIDAGRKLNKALRAAGMENNLSNLAWAAEWVLGYMKHFRKFEEQGGGQ